MTTESQPKNTLHYNVPGWGQFRMTYGLIGLNRLEFKPEETCNQCFSFIEPDEPPVNLRIENGIRQQTARQLEEYLIGKRYGFDFPVEIPIDLETKWVQAIRAIEYGKIATYADIADKTNDPFTVKAIVAVLMKNPLPLVIPCHRIVAGAGDIGGYVWGRKIKQRLLNLEALNCHKITSR